MPTQDDWIKQYKEKSALWIHDGNPKRPHALLTSGKHSNGFFNSRLVLPDDALLYDAAADLLDLFVFQGGNVSKVQTVVGPMTGATKLAEVLSTQIIGHTCGSCFWASPEKREWVGKRSMVFHEEEFPFLLNHSILLCEDVLTTGGSVDLTVDAITNAGGAVLPFVLTLVNRSGLMEVNGKQILSLIDHPMPMWAPEECPLCKEGSEAIRPKGPQEWARLNATY